MKTPKLIAATLCLTTLSSTACSINNEERQTVGQWMDENREDRLNVSQSAGDFFTLLSKPLTSEEKDILNTIKDYDNPSVNEMTGVMNQFGIYNFINPSDLTDEDALRLPSFLVLMKKLAGDRDIITVDEEAVSIFGNKAVLNPDKIEGIDPDLIKATQFYQDESGRWWLLLDPIREYTGVYRSPASSISSLVEEKLN